MAIKTMYDIIEAGYQFTNFQKFNVGENPVLLPVRLFYADGMTIRHEGVTMLTESDYSAAEIDQPLTDRFGKTVYKRLFITNPIYQSGMLEITFTGVGDFLKATDISDIKNEIDTKFDKVGGEIEGNIVVRDIMPNMTGGSNGVSLRNIGSPTQKFNSVYADEIFVGASSLYVNGKKVIEDVSNVMEFKTSIDQGMTIKTTSTTPGSGSGNLSFSSGNIIDLSGRGGINITTPAGVSSKNVTISSESSNGQVMLSSLTEVDITAPIIDLNGAVQVSSLIVEGNLTVQGTTTTINTQTLTIQDNIIELNNNQSGIPPSTLTSGISVNRGDSPAYRFIFNENDDTFRIGETSFEQAVATRQDIPATNGIAIWNNTSKRFDTISTLTYSGTTLKVGGVNFHVDAVNPTGATRLNMDGYFYATRVYNAVYNDLAEFMFKSEDAEPGMVLVMDGRKVKPCTSRGDAAVVGVYSDSYGYALGAEDSESKLPVGISGRVNVWIEEPCKTGDLLITSDKKGFATVKRAREDGQGKIFAKVLQDKTSSTVERIEALILMA